MTDSNALTIKNIAPILEHIVSYINEGVMIADVQGNILYHNPAASELLSQPTDTPMHNLRVTPELNLQKNILDAELNKKSLKNSGQFIQFRIEIETESDDIRCIEVNTGRVTLRDGATQVRLVLLSDRTEHVRLEAVLSKTQNNGFISRDPEVLSVLTRIRHIANTKASVLLQGESGTGKTHLARWIHTLSSRSRQKFVEVNCAAIPESLTESELFGHVKGAFTGATQNRQGRFLAAHNGTIFLDEISEIPLHLQAKLLRAIQDQAFEPVGSDKTVQVTTRIIAASNQNLRSWVEDGRFRADLYYRLAVIPLIVPPLRERPGDIPLLVQHFLALLAKRGYSNSVKLGSDAQQLLMNYPWPGSVRELENALEHGLICAVKGKITAQSLPQDIHRYSREELNLLSDDPQEAERIEIKRALAQANGSRSIAANALHIDRTTLWRRMNKLGIK